MLQICYEVLGKNMSAFNIPYLIMCAVNNFTSSKISESELSSLSFINTMNLEISNTCGKHEAEIFSDEENLIILRDGTTNKERQIFEVIVSSEKDTVTVGLREVAQGTAIQLFTTITQIINDIENMAEQKRLNIIKSVTNTMTDMFANKLKVRKCC